MLFYVDINEGNGIKRIDISEWWVRYEENAPQISLGPTTLEIRNDKMYLNCFVSCMEMMIDVYYENDEDAVLRVNQNGDYIGDTHSAEDSETPWVCNDYSAGPWKYVGSMY